MDLGKLNQFLREKRGRLVIMHWPARSNKSKRLATVVQRLDNAIHRINHYPVDSLVCFVNTYPLDSDLFGG